MNRAVGFVLAFLVLGPTLAYAVEITATLDRRSAQVGDQVVLTVTAEGISRSMSDPKLPDLSNDFEVYSAGTSRNFSLVNGRMSNTLSKRYALVPRREGTFTIGAIEVEISGDIFRTKPLTLAVTKAPPPPEPPPLGADETGSTSGSDALFGRATVDNPSPYLYEQVTYRVRLYTRVNIIDSPSYTPPTTQGFWREDLPPRNPYIETVDGVKYRVMEVTTALFPTTPGKLIIGESVLECTIEDPSRPRDPFSFFGNSRRDGKRVVIRSEPVTIDVKPLPTGAPPGFSGAVGEYQLSVSVDRTEVSQSDPVTLTCTLSGDGHLQTVEDIDLPPLPQFRSYPAESNQETVRNGNRLGGKLTKQFVLVPLSAGELTIPPVTMVVFSPGDGSYRTLASSPIVVTAAPGSGSAISGGGRGDIEVVGRDILFIETAMPSFQAIGSSWAGARTWLMMLPIPIAFYGGFLGWEWRRRKLGGDRALRRRLQAAKNARKILKQSGGSDADVASRAGDAVRSFLADRHDAPQAGLTPDRIEVLLSGDGIDAAPVLEFLDRTDAERYAPQKSGAPEAWIAEAESWIQTLERGS